MPGCQLLLLPLPSSAGFSLAMNLTIEANLLIEALPLETREPHYLNTNFLKKQGDL